MVYYIRFLKPPKFERKKVITKSSRSQKTIFINALISITTDLGDDFLAQNVDLVATWVHGVSHGAVDQVSLQWQAGSRQLQVSLGPFAEEKMSRHPAIVEIRPQDTKEDLLGTKSTPLVISACSAPFKWQSDPAEKLILRNLRIQDTGSKLKIWEETGNSIARHIWDAALASIIFLNEIIAGKDTSMPALSHLLRTPREKLLQAVELGAGCGIVGIALATMLDSCQVILTDLPEVEEIVSRNISHAHLMPSSSITYKNLDWEDPPPNLCSQPIDLILVSDCTYNADSLPTLVSALDRLVRDSPEALVLVALKRRHESEAIFFDLMRSASFFSVQTKVQLPTQHEEFDQIELHCYSHKLAV
ncbi:hypothetical protein N7495_006913 [Penicillium taxi]|uniref:uncharacterized protein n=1 Tax=Penicillium taxi TaxID=168475 RepID=UPI002545A7E5|nr:uncharacterized protein N7495_006913 [Penicillium taxi]KAJ5895222.1 hypothetical protein N7495_006913 [Penicillium taxi]